MDKHGEPVDRFRCVERIENELVSVSVGPAVFRSLENRESV